MTQLVIYDRTTQNPLVGFPVAAPLYMVTCHLELRVGQKFVQRLDGEVGINWYGHKGQTWPPGTHEQLEVLHTKILFCSHDVCFPIWFADSA